MHPRDQFEDKKIREWLSGKLLEKAPPGFTSRIMEKVQVIEPASRYNFITWLNEYLYYILAVVFTGGMGFYFSGPYNWFNTGNPGMRVIHFIQTWREGLQTFLSHWSFSGQWSLITMIVMLALAGFLLLDLMIMRRMRAST